MRIVFVTTGLSTGGAEITLFKVLDRQYLTPQVISPTPLGGLAPRIAALDDPVLPNVARRAADFSITSAMEEYLQALQVTIPNESGCGAST